MPVDDRTRLILRRKLEETLGSEGADALMAHRPPVTWNQVAAKDDLDKLTTRAELEVGCSSLWGRAHRGTNQQIKWLVTFAAAWSSLLVTVVRLLP